MPPTSGGVSDPGYDGVEIITLGLSMLSVSGGLPMPTIESDVSTIRSDICRYKVQNLASQMYLEILEHSRGLCSRPATVLSPLQDVLVILTCFRPLERLTFLTSRSGRFNRPGRDTG